MPVSLNTWQTLLSNSTDGWIKIHSQFKKKEGGKSTWRSNFSFCWKRVEWKIGRKTIYDRRCPKSMALCCLKKKHRIIQTFTRKMPTENLCAVSIRVVKPKIKLISSSFFQNLDARQCNQRTWCIHLKEKKNAFQHIDGKTLHYQIPRVVANSSGQRNTRHHTPLQNFSNTREFFYLFFWK